jgi:hypothetical protein
MIIKMMNSSCHLFQIFLENIFLVNEISPGNTDENVSEMLAAKVENLDLKLKEKEKLLKTICLFANIMIKRDQWFASHSFTGIQD